MRLRKFLGTLERIILGSAMSAVLLLAERRLNRTKSPEKTD
jgi:hypothetical protein